MRETNIGIFHHHMTMGDFLLTFISLLILSAGVFCILFVLWGGVKLILSRGQEDKIKPAMRTIKYAIGGLIVSVATIFLFPILGNLLGIDVKQYADPRMILKKIEIIGNKIFDTKLQDNSLTLTKEPTFSKTHLPTTPEQERIVSESDINRYVKKEEGEGTEKDKSSVSTLPRHRDF